MSRRQTTEVACDRCGKSIGTYNPDQLDLNDEVVNEIQQTRIVGVPSGTYTYDFCASCAGELRALIDSWIRHRR